MPLTIIRGAAGDGAGVAVIGGTHGNEYEGQIAVKRLCQNIDANELCGRVVLMPQLSESACRAGTRVSPLDGVNMNRAFPGNARGSLSHRVAHFVKTAVFPHVRVVIDIHSGGREAVFPLCTSFHRLPDIVQFAEISRAARLFNTPFPFVYSRQMASGLLSDEAEDGDRAPEDVLREIARLLAPSPRWSRRSRGKTALDGRSGSAHTTKYRHHHDPQISGR